MKKIKVGIASYGKSGQVFHGPIIKSLSDEFEIVAVHERTKNESAKVLPNATIVRTYQELIDFPGIELIVVNTPDVLHYEMTKQAINAGKHVVVEKPIAKYSNEASELIQLAKEKGVVFSVYQNRRFDGGFMTVKKLIEDNALGDIVDYHCNFTRYRNFINEGTWREEQHERGGVLFDLGTHLVDQAVVLFGQPNSVTAQLEARRTGSRVNDYFDIRLNYDNHVAILGCSFLVREPAPVFVVNGKLGSYLKYGPDPQEEQLMGGIFPMDEGYGIDEKESWGILNTELPEGELTREAYETIEGDYRLYYKSIYSAIREGKELIVKPEEALLTTKILEACIVSNKERRTVDCDF
jgi:scyllo-inositol 2-dehydrogenase (NADP+)